MATLTNRQSLTLEEALEATAGVRAWWDDAMRRMARVPILSINGRDVTPRQLAAAKAMARAKRR